MTSIRLIALRKSLFAATSTSAMLIATSAKAQISGGASFLSRISIGIRIVSDRLRSRRGGESKVYLVRAQGF
jgi:hypothetical protein